MVSILLIVIIGFAIGIVTNLHNILGSKVFNFIIGSVFFGLDLLLNILKKNGITLFGWIVQSFPDTTVAFAAGYIIGSFTPSLLMILGNILSVIPFLSPFGQMIVTISSPFGGRT